MRLVRIGVERSENVTDGNAYMNVPLEVRRVRITYDAGEQRRNRFARGVGRRELLVG